MPQVFVIFFDSLMMGPVVADNAVPSDVYIGCN